MGDSSDAQKVSNPVATESSTRPSKSDDFF
jgi:hypothetical protein